MDFIVNLTLLALCSVGIANCGTDWVSLDGKQVDKIQLEKASQKCKVDTDINDIIIECMKKEGFKIK